MTPKTNEWEELKRHLSRDYVEKGWTAVTTSIVEDLLTRATAEAYERGYYEGEKNEFHNQAGAIQEAVEGERERAVALLKKLPLKGIDGDGYTKVKMHDLDDLLSSLTGERS